MECVVIDEPMKGSLESQAEQSITRLRRSISEQGYKIKNIVKLNIFLRTENNEEFFEIKQEIESIINSVFKNNIPAYTIIGQPPLSGNSILVEGYVLSNSNEAKVERYKLNKHPYVIVSYSNDKRREIYSGGISIDSSRDFISDCQNAFDFSELILGKEDMTFGNVVRQWNYIPSILSVNKFEKSELQNYQIFNDIRALYYNADLFEEGYPAATGIGTNYGSVTIDFIAVDTKHVVSVKSPVQQNAYSYTENVLEGEALSTESGKKPPLFERGKVVSSPDKDYIYISGTASIRGEKTISSGNIEEQTKVTIENIKELTVKKNMKSIGVEGSDSPMYDYVRVYIKNSNDLDTVKHVVEKYMKAKSIVFVEADICRNNLLVEIEADIVIKK